MKEIENDLTKKEKKKIKKGILKVQLKIPFQKD